MKSLFLMIAFLIGLNSISLEQATNPLSQRENLMKESQRLDNNEICKYESLLVENSPWVSGWKTDEKILLFQSETNCKKNGSSNFRFPTNLSVQIFQCWT